MSRRIQRMHHLSACMLMTVRDGMLRLRLRKQLAMHAAGVF